MVFAGRPAQDVATSLGINVGMIHKWRAQHTESKGSSRPLVPIAVLTVSGAEHERVKARLREVEQERDILKKALGIFSRGI